MREASDHMVREHVGRLPVIDRAGTLVGILSRSDLLAAHAQRLDSARKLGRGRRHRARIQPTGEHEVVLPR